MIWYMNDEMKSLPPILIEKNSFLPSIYQKTYYCVLDSKQYRRRLQIWSVRLCSIWTIGIASQEWGYCCYFFGKCKHFTNHTQQFQFLQNTQGERDFDIQCWWWDEWHDGYSNRYWQQTICLRHFVIGSRKNELIAPCYTKIEAGCGESILGDHTSRKERYWRKCFWYTGFASHGQQKKAKIATSCSWYYQKWCSAQVIL